MHTDDPKAPSDDSHDLPPMTRDAFDLGQLEAMRDDEADAEWLRHPEAWHLH
jgi:hypothetical protein